jgi:hypothetical protein
MGVSLSYRTIEPVSARVKAAILADVKRINGQRRWWCEGLIFYEERKRTRHLTGDTKLFFPAGYTDGDADAGLTEVDSDDDLFMGFRDAAFILRQLMRWSEERGVSWSLDMAGAEVGTVGGGKVEPAGLFDCDKPERKADEQKAARLQKKYASR